MVGTWTWLLALAVVPLALLAASRLTSVTGRFELTEGMAFDGTLLRRLPNLAVAEDNLQWRPHGLLRALWKLPVKF